MMISFKAGLAGILACAPAFALAAAIPFTNAPLPDNGTIPAGEFIVMQDGRVTLSDGGKPLGRLSVVKKGEAIPFLAWHADADEGSQWLAFDVTSADGEYERGVLCKLDAASGRQQWCQTIYAFNMGAARLGKQIVALASGELRLFDAAAGTEIRRSKLKYRDDTTLCQAMEVPQGLQLLTGSYRAPRAHRSVLRANGTVAYLSDVDAKGVCP
jgi:hypothetical protein